ncbi:MAG: MFS transporter [Polyangia bacterium]|jgi:MFS family permease|nr:MFS transporter [Polyangia bacterium]
MAGPPVSDSTGNKSVWRELTQPFVDLINAPRALWGVNLSYMLEGLVYFGMLGYLAMHFSGFVFGGMKGADELSHNMVMVLTAGITISMFFLGFVADRWGVRFALISAFLLMIAGRVIISAAPTLLGFRPDGLWSPLHLTTMGGILLVVVGYGMYQPAAYAAVRKFTTPKTAAMGFAMLYALMNLGGWLPTFAFLLRDEKFAGFGITGTFWVYTAITLLALLATVILLSRKTVNEATARARSETERIAAQESGEKPQADADPSADGKPKAQKAAAPTRELVPVHLWIFIMLVMAALWLKGPKAHNLNFILAGALGGLAVVAQLHVPWRRWLSSHPLADGKFFFFIFALIPVQTLFTYNWLILPQYINRSFDGWIGKYFEIAANANPLLIFVAVPVITALTQKAKVYNMMILGTFVMAAPAFLLTAGPHPWALFAYLLIMTIGEAMWQPRFLQYAAEIAPEGRTGQYMGVAQLPWFLTKMLVPWLYSGWMMDRFCPAQGVKNTELMWLFFGLIAISSTVMLVVAKPWIGKDFKTKADA